MALNPNIPLMAGQIQNPVNQLTQGLMGGLQFAQQAAANRRASELQAAKLKELEMNRRKEAALYGARRLLELEHESKDANKTMQLRAAALPLVNKEIETMYGIAPDAEASQNIPVSTQGLKGIIRGFGVEVDTVSEREKFNEQKRQFGTTFNYKAHQANLAALESTMKGDKEKFSQAAKLRGELQKATSTFGDIENAFGRIQATQEGQITGASDLSLIFNFMKMLDPGSTVREGEFATAENAGGVPDRIRTTYSKLLNGERLTEKQRAMFVSEATKLMNKATEINNKRVNDYVNLGKRYGLEREDIAIGQTSSQTPISAPPVPTSTPAVPTGRGARSSRRSSGTKVGRFTILN